MFVSFDCDLPFSLERKKGWCSTCTWLKLGFCLSINFRNKVPICQYFILQIVYLVIKFHPHGHPPSHQGFEPLDLFSQLKRFYQLTSWHSIRKIGFVRSCYRALFELFFLFPSSESICNSLGEARSTLLCPESICWGIGTLGETGGQSTGYWLVS